MKTKNGFTLVELMVVVIIVGILAAVAVPVYSAMREKAVIAEGLAMIAQVNVSGQSYMVQVGGDVTAFSDLTHLEGVGLLSAVSLDGTYFNNGDYGNWQFDSQAKVIHVDVGDWAITWDDVSSKYNSVKNP